MDALLGTGFRGEPSQRYAALIDWANQTKANNGIAIIAVDIPSGLDGTTGMPSAATIKANKTIAFHAAKTGLLKPGAKPFVGRLHIVDIGIPDRI